MLQEYLSIFIVFAIFGWILEVIYRSIKDKKIINPGFLRGPYLPIYGFGGLLLFIINYFFTNLVTVIFISAVIMIILELITGWIFIKHFNSKLWDYSDRFLNYKGLICLEYSIYWIILVIIFALFINPFLPFKIDLFILFIAYFIFFMDLLYSTFNKRKLNF